MSAMNPQK
ncbi:MAG: hypothetical protein EZS28_041809, partial [Streblomastix strix]